MSTAYEMADERLQELREMTKTDDMGLGRNGMITWDHYKEVVGIAGLAFLGHDALKKCFKKFAIVQTVDGEWFCDYSEAASALQMASALAKQKK